MHILAMGLKEMSAELRDTIVLRHISGEGYNCFWCIESSQEHSGLHNYYMAEVWNNQDSSWLRGSAEKNGRKSPNACIQSLSCHPRRLAAKGASTKYWVKGLNTYVILPFFHFHFISKILPSLCHYYWVLSAEFLFKSILAQGCNVTKCEKVKRSECTVYTRTHCMHSSTHAHTHTHTHTQTRTHAQTHTHAYTHTHTYCIHTHSHTRMHTQTYTHAYTHRHTYTHTHTHRHTHSHTQTHTQAHTEAHTHKHRHTHTLTHILRHTHSHTQAHAHTHTHSQTQTHAHTHTALDLYQCSGISSPVVSLSAALHPPKLNVLALGHWGWRGQAVH